MAYDITVGVRRDDPTLQRDLDEAFRREHAAIDGALPDYGVPRVAASRALTGK